MLCGVALHCICVFAQTVAHFSDSACWYQQLSLVFYCCILLLEQGDAVASDTSDNTTTASTEQHAQLLRELEDARYQLAQTSTNIYLLNAQPNILIE
jgi:hypothetical protein